MIDRIESYKRNNVLGFPIFYSRKRCEGFCGRSPTVKHENRSFLLNFIHNMDIESDEEEVKILSGNQGLKHQ